MYVEPTMYCMECIAWSVLHGVYCMECIAWSVLHGVYCMECIAHCWLGIEYPTYLSECAEYFCCVVA